MGVPALFRWLSKKYPKIISPVIEERPHEIENSDGTKTSIPVDTTKPNPNDEEFDNLYLDMNGIVHPCSHPEDRPPPANEQEMMIAVFEYTERVVQMVRPRKLLLIAVDGVAPRAKMNQQRSRRFRAAQEAAEKDKQTAEFHAMLKASGQVDDDGEDGEDSGPKKTWDSNSITPGTPFMDLLAASLRYWASYKASTDPAWAKLKVIISDATVPGEGEHKIMNFVRSQRNSPTHDPNTRHVMYGLDADLIMLGLATHEPHFRILREDVFANDTKPGHCRKCNQPGHKADECRGTAAKKTGPDGKPPLKPFIWLHVKTLREYLAIEMRPPNQQFEFQLERALDDWVFMCFFVGNDFLPHLPSLDIREDGIDTLMAIWRDNLPVMGGYLTKDGHVDLTRAQIILEGLAKQEDAIFKRRREADLKREAAEKRRAEQQDRRGGVGKRMRFSGGPENGAPSGYDESMIRRGPKGGIIRGEAAPDINALPTFAPGDAQTRNDPRYTQNLTHADIVGGKTVEQTNKENKSAAAALKEKMMGSNKSSDNQKAEVDALFANGANGSESSAVLGKRTRDMIDEAADDGPGSDPSTPGRNTPNKEIANGGTSGALGGNSTTENATSEDTVKLWEEGYQDRYYEQKFHVSPDNIEFRHEVARSYVEGLCWVLLYYFQGCPSWTWYYPYHYAPFAADFKDIDKMTVSFDKGKPFRPYEQLMGVMPPASNHTIPEVFHPLMTDEDSPIKEFYPIDFDVDLNGKKFAWQGVVILPFIDEKRLLEAMGTKYPQLTEDEVRRNEFGEDALIFSTKHPLYEEVVKNFYGRNAGAPKFNLKSHISEGLSGKVTKNEAFVPDSSLRLPFDSTGEDYTDLDTDESVSVSYHMPPISGLHKSMLLPGIDFGPSALDFHDIRSTQERTFKTGRSHGGVQLSQNGDRSDGRRINYAARDGGRPPNGHYNQGPPPNAFQGQAAQAFANLPPHLAQQAAAHGFAPPPGGGPPMPPGHQFPPRGQPPMPPMPPQGQGYRPPPQQQGRGYHDRPGYGNGYDNRGGYDSRSGYGGGYNGGGYHGGRGGGGRRY